MRLVQLFLGLIRAEPEGNWELHLSSFAAMLPWFAIYDRLYEFFKMESCLFGRYENVEESHPDIFVKKPMQVSL